MTWAAPFREERLVWADRTGGYGYVGGCWTRFLTNALHDAGWHVTQTRRKAAKATR